MFSRLIGGAEVFGSFSFDPDSTVAAIAPVVFERWKLNPADFELGTCDCATHASVLADPAKKLSEIYVEDIILQVRRAGEFPRVEIVRAEAAPVEPARLSVTGNCLTIGFKMIEGGDRFSLQLQKSDTVKTAKEEVARRLGLESVEWVTLLFGGKPLADQFILGRLRLGHSDISVYVKDANEVLLVTGMAMR
jgi:hypothetical protein